MDGEMDWHNSKNLAIIPHKQIRTKSQLIASFSRSQIDSIESIHIQIEWHKSNRKKRHAYKKMMDKKKAGNFFLWITELIRSVHYSSIIFGPKSFTIKWIRAVIIYKLN